MRMPSPSVSTPTMRSPGSAPPSSNDTGTSLRTPRMGSTCCCACLSLLPLPGQRNLRPMPLAMLNQPSSLWLRSRRCAGLRRAAACLASSASGTAARTTSLTGSSPRPTAANTSSIDFCVRRCSPFLSLSSVIFLADPAERRHQQAPAELGILLAQGLARRAADGRSRLAGDGDALPCGGRRLALGGQHLHLVAVPELRGERHLPPVDHRARRRNCRCRYAPHRQNRSALRRAAARSAGPWA